MLFRGITLVAAALLQALVIRGAKNSLQQVTAYIGPNPNNVGMYVYKPTKISSPTALIVAVHYCSGSAQAYFTGTQYANLADTYGFIVIYPDAPRSGKCFDVNTDATLSHNGGGDSQGIASMVTYAINNYGVNSGHVYVTGSSSGAMMTNVLAGSYPELFQAASAYSGVPFGCFAGSSSWNSACAGGQISKTAQQWGDIVRAAYPGYTGSRPKMMLWHGTADTTLYYNNYLEAVKEWTNVLGVSQTATTTTSNDPQSGYTRTTYGSPAVVVGYSGQGVGHGVPVHESVDLTWFGIPITGSTSTTSTSRSSTSSSSRSSSSSSSTSTGGSSGCSAHWAQCGGQGWTGPTCCVSGTTCTYSNDWYSQCI